MQTIIVLDALIEKLKAAGLPFGGMSAGSSSDKSTWRIQWATEPTAQQLTQAQAIIDAFDIPTEEAKATEDAGIARGEIMAKGIVNLLVAKGVCTLAEAKASIKAAWVASQ